MKFLITANIDTDALRHNFDYRITNYGGKCAATSRNMSKHVERDTNATPPISILYGKISSILSTTLNEKKRKIYKHYTKTLLKEIKHRSHQNVTKLQACYDIFSSKLSRQSIENLSKWKSKPSKLKPWNKNKKNHIKMKQQVNSNLDSTNHESSMVTIDRKKHRKI